MNCEDKIFPQQICAYCNVTVKDCKCFAGMWRELGMCKTRIAMLESDTKKVLDNTSKFDIAYTEKLKAQIMFLEKCLEQKNRRITELEKTLSNSGLNTNNWNVPL